MNHAVAVLFPLAFPLVALLVPVPPLAAQSTQVIPIGVTDTPASAVTAWPFGLSSACRIQYLYAAHETGLPPAAVLLALEVRGQESVANTPKTSIDLQIELSTTPVTPMAATGLFASNHGTSRTVVYTRKMTSLNATTAGRIGGWSGRMMFDAPFVYLAAPNANLLIDYDVASQPASNWQTDTTYLPLAVHATLGSGCGGLQITSAGGLVGNLLTFDLTSAPPNTPAAVLLGQNELPVPLPVPGNPACSVYQDFPFVIPTTVTPSGNARFGINVPMNDYMRGQAVYCQFATALGGQLVTSASRRVFLGGQWDTARIYNTMTNLGASGAVQQGVGLVTRLHY